MGFFKTQKEKEERMEEREKSKAEIQKRNETRKKALQEQNKNYEEIRNLYRDRIREEKRLKESAKSKN
jgi:hypothetical protein